MRTPTTTKIGSLTVLNNDDNKLLHLLLRSVPSAQYRPDLKPDFEVMEDELLLLPPPPCRGVADASAAKMTGVKVKMESEAGKSVPGMLARIGALFSRLTAVKVEENTDSQPSIKVEKPVLLKDVDIATSEAEDTRSQSDRTMSGEDEDDEMEVEYMIFAEKCVAINTMSIPTAKRRRKRSTRQGKSSQGPDSPSRKRRSKSNTLCPPSTPPSIERRRQQVIDQTSAKGPSPRMKRKGVPGFM